MLKLESILNLSIYSHLFFFFLCLAFGPAEGLGISYFRMAISWDHVRHEPHGESLSLCPGNLHDRAFLGTSGADSGEVYVNGHLAQSWTPALWTPFCQAGAPGGLATGGGGAGLEREWALGVRVCAGCSYVSGRGCLARAPSRGAWRGVSQDTTSLSCFAVSFPLPEAPDCGVSLTHSCAMCPVLVSKGQCCWHRGGLAECSVLSRNTQGPYSWGLHLHPCPCPQCLLAPPLLGGHKGKVSP